MKKILLLISIVYYGQVNSQTYVLIPDTNFVAYLQSIVPTAMNGDSLNTSSTAVSTCTSIYVEDKNISNLFGIQYFTSLTLLNCARNNLTSLPPLPNTLQFLECSRNSLTYLPTLPNSLQELGCMINLSLSNLPALPNSLKYLNCISTNLTSLPTLPDSLQTLFCSQNNITCFPTFPNSITNLDIWSNPCNCLPNYIEAMGNIAIPLCTTGNSNGCSVVAPNCSSNFTYSVGVGIDSGHVYFSILSSGYSNTWYFNGYDTTIFGSNAEHYFYNGSYMVQCVSNDSAGNIICISTDTITITNNFNPNVGINTVYSKSEKINIYPNPTNDQFYIDANTTDKLNVDLYDVKGRHVFSAKVSDKSNIKVANLDGGIYSMIIRTANSITNKKLIILR